VVEGPVLKHQDNKVLNSSRWRRQRNISSVLALTSFVGKLT
jgi:hypothetical protein